MIENKKQNIKTYIDKDTAKEGYTSKRGVHREIDNLMFNFIALEK